MPQFQIRKHPHGGTWQIFFLNVIGVPAKSWYEGNSVQDCIDWIYSYMSKNVLAPRLKWFLEVFPD